MTKNRIDFFAEAAFTVLSGGIKPKYTYVHAYSGKSARADAIDGNFYRGVSLTREWGKNYTKLGTTESFKQLKPLGCLTHLKHIVSIKETHTTNSHVKIGVPHVGTGDDIDEAIGTFRSHVNDIVAAEGLIIDLLKNDEEKVGEYIQTIIDFQAKHTRSVIPIDDYEISLIYDKGKEKNIRFLTGFGQSYWQSLEVGSNIRMKEEDPISKITKAMDEMKEVLEFQRKELGKITK